MTEQTAISSLTAKPLSQVPILPAFDQYCLDLTTVRNKEPEDVVLARVRSGEPESIVQMLSCALPGVVRLAYRYKVYMPHDGLEDLVAIGNLAMMECVPKALTKSNSIGYLVGCARIAIVDYVGKHSSLISKQWYDEVTPIAPLDDALKKPAQEPAESLSEADERLLYRAVKSLTPIQQMVVRAQFRLSGRTDDNLFQLHKRTGKKCGYYNKMIAPALKKMRVFLCEKKAAYR